MVMLTKANNMLVTDSTSAAMTILMFNRRRTARDRACTDDGTTHISFLITVNSSM